MKKSLRGFSKKRGAGILTVLTASTLLLLLGLTVAGTSFHHLSVSNRLHHSQNARNLAEDCLARATAQILAQPTRYRNPNYTGFTPLPSATAPLYERGILTFDPSELGTLNGTLTNPVLIASLNNLANESSAPIGNGSASVPPHSLYLRAVGVDHGVERAMECVLWVPPFPYAMAAGGTIKIAGASNVASVDNVADAADPTKWLPGSLVSNFKDPAGAVDSVELKDDVTVTGDLQAHGTGKILNNSVVKGEKRFNAPPVRIPTINITDYDTSGKANVLTYSTQFPSSNQVNGFAYRSGALTYNSGIDLHNGVVYVNGPLTINGPISGKGALISTGTITINGSGSIAANNEVAILSKSDMTLTGSSTNHVGASGLLYSEGKMTASYADISGSAAAPKDTSSIEFTNVNMIQNSSASQLSVQVGGPPTAPGTPSFQQISPGGGSWSSGQAASDGIVGASPVAGVVMRGGSPVVFPASVFPVTAEIKASNPAPDPVDGIVKYDPNRFKDPATGEFHLPVPMNNAHDINGVVLPPGNYETLIDPVSGLNYQIPSTSAVPPLSPAEVTIRVNGVAYNGDNTAWQTAARDGTRDAMNTILGANPLSASEENTTIDTTSPVTPFKILYADPATMLQNVVARSSTVIKATEDYQIYNTALATSSGPGETVTFSMTPTIYEYNSGLANGNFINLADNIRILYWREVPLP